MTASQRFIKVGSKPEDRSISAKQFSDGAHQFDPSFESSVPLKNVADTSSADEMTVSTVSD
jgi:hypothetical protein